MKKVLITGANGFLGSNLVRSLYRQGFDVKIIVRPNANINTIVDVPCEIIYGNIDNLSDVQQAIAGCDIVIHAASITEQWGVTFSDYERINFLATKYIADACVKNKVSRFVYVSTANTIGPGEKNSPGTELNGFTLFNANSGYINTKYLAQQYVLEQVQANRLEAIVVNPTFMIGPEDNKPSSGKLLLYGLKNKILLYPPGGKNFVFIQDVCQGIINALNYGKTGDCYLLAGENLSYKEFFILLNKISGKKKIMIKIPTLLLKLLGYIGSISKQLTGRAFKLNTSTAYMLCLDNYYSGKKSERELGVKYTPMKHAIKKALEWFKENNYC